MPPSQIELIVQALPPKRRRARMGRGRFPLNIERQLVGTFRDYVRAQFELLEQLLLPRLGELGRLAGVRQDAVKPWRDDFTSADVWRDIHAQLARFGVTRQDQSPWRALLRQIMSDVAQRYERVQGVVRQDSEDAARQMSLFSRQEIARQMRQVVGVDVFAENPELVDLLEQWVEANVSKITTTSAENFATIENIVSNGFRSGQRASTVGDSIVKAVGVSQSKAEFWARDQIGTLNGQLAQQRQTALGLDEYIWRTSRDELVRESHRQLEGTTQRWDDPPTVGVRQVHPGEDYNCRCTPEPKIPGVETIETGPENVKRDPELVKRRRNRDRRRRERNRRRQLSQPSGIDV